MRSFISALAILVPLLAPTAATAECLATPATTSLKVQGDHFTINDQPKFLVFVSYFDAVHRAPNLALLIQDLCYFKNSGVNGIRVFPNWTQSRTGSVALMRADGTLDPAQLGNLRTLIDEAGKRGLVVDVTFDFVVAMGSQTVYKSAVGLAAQALQDKTNILFDLQNEFDATPRPASMSVDQWGQYLATEVKAAAKPAGSSRIVTVSRGSDRIRSVLFDEVQTYQLDVLPVHYRFGAQPPFSGSGGWWQDTTPYANDFKARFAARPPRRPIYFQEPSRFHCGTSAGDEEPQHYKDAVRDAKAAGAAAWTFHNCGTKDLSGSTTFENLLDPLERDILNYIGSTPFKSLAWPARLKLPPADFDGDGRTDVAVFRPSTSNIFILGSTTSATYTWGGGGDVPVDGDYDGDGRSDVALFRPSTGQWFTIWSSTGTGVTYTYGGGGDIPVPGDYDGDGKTDIAVFRPSASTWFIGTGVTYAWGGGADIPVPADYDGDGRTDVAVFRPSTGQWFIIGSSTGTGIVYTYGGGGDIPVPGDYDGDGKADIAVFRASASTWFIGTGVTYAWGGGGDVPVPGDYDGDAKTDVAVFRPSTGVWYIIRSSTQTGITHTWGGPGDIPILARP